MSAKVFISYRREDARYQARMIYGAFTQVLPRENVFMDIDSIPLGSDFRKILKDWVNACDMLLALIGPGWVSATDPKTGQPRLKNPADFVRIEIGEALARDIRVIPVLLDGAAMPDAGLLPDDLRDLIYRHAEFVEYGRFDDDVARLIRKLRLGAEAPKAGPQPAPSPLPAPSAAPAPSASAPTRATLPPPRALPASVMRQITDSFLPVVRSIKDHESLARGLSALAIARAKAGLPDDVDALLEEASRATHAIGVPKDRARCLSYLARYYAHAGRFPQALQLSRSTGEAFWQNAAMQEISDALAEARRFEEALQVARSISDQEARVSALCRIAKDQAKAGLTGQALQGLQMVRIEAANDRSRWDVVGALADVGEFSQAMELARSIEDGFYRALPIRNILGLGQDSPPPLTRSQLDEVAQLAKSIDDQTRAQRLAEVAMAQAYASLAREADDNLREAIRLAAGIEREFWRDSAYEAIAKAQALLDRLPDALHTAQLSKSKGVIAQIAGMLARSGRIPLALSFVRLVQHVGQRAAALAAIAEAQIRAGLIADAVATLAQASVGAHAVSEANERLEVFLDIAAAQERAGLKPEAAASLATALQASRSVGGAELSWAMWKLIYFASPA